MKVHVYYTADPASGYTTAYLDDDPLVGGHHPGITKHSDQDLMASFVPERARWEIDWIEPFDARKFL